jgi:hypothetical protein
MPVGSAGLNAWHGAWQAIDGPEVYLAALVMGGIR